MSNKRKNKNSRSFSSALFGSLFGNRKELGIFEEEEIQSPFRTVVNTYRENTIAMVALIVFILIFLIVSIGPMIFPIDLSFSETSQQNIGPGRDMLAIPSELQGNLRDMGIGSTFTAAASEDGEMYIWGRTRVSSIIDLKDMPQDMGKVEKVAAGYDHIIYLQEDGTLSGWGSNRQKQLDVPEDIKNINPDDVKEIYAGYQNSLILMNNGELHYFGNTMNNDYNSMHEYQGELDEIAVLSDGVMGLTYDGEVVYLGSEQNSYSMIPADMGKVVDIAATSSSIVAVNEDGEVFTWGNLGARTSSKLPELKDEKIVELSAGRFHYNGITDKGNVISWGADYYDQTQVPASLDGVEVEKVYSGFYQNYAVVKDTGKVETWGLKGYMLGTDELGRDIFTRLLNGGRMSMTIGAIAVIISTLIGVIVGGVSGYFGGTIDNILQRFAEMVGSLPFLPFAMILSSLIGNSLPTKQKTFMLMVILGLLSWTGLQRLVRAQVLSVREEEYVIAAQAVGIKESHIIFRHILPNVISVVIVSATLSFGSSMLTEATLSYLGFGVQAPQPTWGNMLFGANDSIVIQNYWWRWVFASLILGICVICINLIGEGLRDAIDPKSRER